MRHAFLAVLPVLPTVAHAAGNCAVDTAANSTCTTYATQAQLQSAVVGYTTASPAAGSTVAMPANRGVLLLQGSTLLATLTVLLPPSPTDGQVARIASQMAVTALTVKDAAGNAVTGGSLALGVFGVGALWQYQGSAWVRIG